jgi:uncharacterized delta-60 repeat protein
VQQLALEPDGRIVIAGGFGYVEGVLEAGLARLYGDDRTATPVIEINGKAFRAWQSDANVSVPVLRSGNTNTTVSVQYATTDFDAQAGSDYVATSGTLIFAPGEVAKSVSVPLLNDGQVESFERFGVLLTNASGGVLGTSTTATITVLGVNNVMQINTPDIATNELAGALSITISRVGTNVASSASCQTVDGTAVTDINYSNLTQVVSFAPGQTAQTVSVTLLDDALPGPDTFFSIVLTNGVNGQIGARSNLTVTLLDNDAPGHPAFGLNARVSAVASTADGAVVLGGNFSSINGTSRNRIGKVHADEALDQSFDPGTGANSSVSAVLVQPDGKILCGGSFSSHNGTPRAGLMRLNPDGSLDDGFDPGAGPNNAVTALAPSTNAAFFIGGRFTAYGSAPRPGVAKINADGTPNTNFVPQIPGSPLIVWCVATQSGGGLLVGLDSYFGRNTNLCVRLKPDGSLDTTFTNRIRGSSSQAQVQSIVVQPDGKILLGGYFATVNGTNRNNIARLNADGSLDSAFNPSSGANSIVYKLLLTDNGQIIATGSFTSYAGVSRNRIVRINGNGSIDLAFDPGGGADLTIFDVATLPSNRWAVGGSFRNFAGFPRYYFAVLNSNGQLATHISFESFAATDNLQFGMRVEPEIPFQLLSSSNLINWQVLCSNLVHQSFTNLTLPRTTEDRQFFRTWQGQ